MEKALDRLKDQESEGFQCQALEPANVESRFWKGPCFQLTQAEPDAGQKAAAVIFCEESFELQQSEMEFQAGSRDPECEA